MRKVVPPAKEFLLPLIVCALVSLSCSSPSIAGAGQQSESPHFKFTWEGSGRTMEDGAPASFSRYKSDDGFTVMRVVESYKSDHEATAALDRLIKGASNILQRAQKEKPGGLPGTRVELLFDRSGQGASKTVIAWTEGSRVFQLRSASRPHVEDFEKQDYPLAGK